MIETLKQALEECIAEKPAHASVILQNLIAQLEKQEPVAQIEMGKMGGASVDLAKLLNLPIGTPLYTLEKIK